MTKREIVENAFQGKKVPYTPWSLAFTFEAAEKLKKHYGEDFYKELDNHIANYSVIPPQEKVNENLRRDFFGVEWDISQDKDIGIVKNTLLKEADLSLYDFPAPETVKPFLKKQLEWKASNEHNKQYRSFAIGFSLFERAWTLRGMENLLMDFVLNPDFVHELLTCITDFNMTALSYIIDEDFEAVHFGDDWGQQRGLIMGPELWRKFIKPQLKRIYSYVISHGKRVTIHSCGDVQEILDDLVELGLSAFNPFQPEVMNVQEIYRKYKKQLSFIGGLSTQKTLPYGTAEDVERESQELLRMGLDGNYVFAPAHAVEGDVPLENLLAFINTAKNQPGYLALKKDNDVL